MTLIDQAISRLRRDAEIFDAWAKVLATDNQHGRRNADLSFLKTEAAQARTIADQLSKPTHTEGRSA